MSIMKNQVKKMKVRVQGRIQICNSLTPFQINYNAFDVTLDFDSDIGDIDRGYRV